MQRSDPRSATNTKSPAEAGILARIALALTDWTERWVPDAFVFALLATLVVIVAGVAFTPSTSAASDRCVGKRLLGVDPLHAADGAHHHHRLRARHLAAGGAGHPQSRGMADNAAQRRRAGGVLRHGELVVQLGLQPHLQRRARERDRAPRRRASTIARSPPRASSGSAASGRRA